MCNEEIQFKVEEKVGIITLNRPEVLNVINESMKIKLEEIFESVDKDDQIRVLVIQGEGKAFCAGQDLKDSSSKRNSITPVEALYQQWQGDFQDRLAVMKKPTIAAMQGYVIGRGLLIGLCCDIRIAAADATFSLPEVKLGMLPGSGGTQRLPRIIGQGRALHMVLTGDRIDAVTALDWGLVTRIEPAEQLKENTLAFAQRVAKNAPLAMHFAKRSINQSTEMSLFNGINAEAALQTVLRSTEDRREGIQAFKEKRKPDYVGR